MKFSRIVMLAAGFAMAAAIPALAQGRGAAQRPAKVTTAQGPKGQATGKPAAKTPNANKPTDPGANRRADRGKPDTTGKPDTAGKPDSAGKSENAGGRGDMTIAERISANPQQKARLEAMLPSGMSLADAAADFRNQGQFIAALEASKNQGLSFTALKTEMTGPNQLSLGQAIEKLKGSTTGTSGATTQ